MLIDAIQTLPWLPPHSIRRSARSRRVTLRISPKKGFEIVLPRRCREEEVLSFIQNKRIWIEKNLKLIHQLTSQQQSKLILPNELHLRACNEKWQIHYLPALNNTPKILARAHQELVVYGDIEKIELCQFILKRWLQEKAQFFLTDYLKTLGNNYGFNYKKIAIRDQKTRWGSCSASGNINLNFRLIFLQPELTRHILLHELCHTIHLNHSAKFWKLLEKYDENWQLHRRASSRMENLVPCWLTQ